MVTTDDIKQSSDSSVVLGDHLESNGMVAQMGLEASLSQDRDATLLWANEAPLRLVASVLIDAHGRKAKSADIKAALTKDVINIEDWGKWWDPVRFGLKESRYFEYGHPKPIRLRARNPEDVDSDSLDDLRMSMRKAQSASSKRRESSVAPVITGLGGWILWVQSDDDEPLPRSVPPADFVKFLRKLPESVIQTAISRLIDGITLRIFESKQRPAEKSIEMWQESLLSALTRWNELIDPPTIPVADMVDLIARALESLGQEEFKDILLWLAAHISENVENIEIIGNALFISYSKSQDGTERLLTAMASLLEAPVRIALWRRLLRLGLAQSNGAPMGRWLRFLPQDDKTELFTNLLADVHDESSVTEIGNLLGSEWRLANVEQRYQLFDAVALGWVLHRQSLPDVTTAMNEVLMEVDDNHEFEGSLMSEWKGLALSMSENEARQVREDRDRHIGDLEQRLKETEDELNRVSRQVRFLEGENRTKRSNAELELTRGAITVLGIALQSLADSLEPKTRKISDLESGITLALSTLGAKLTGNIGEVVPFDPTLHEAASPLAIGTPVTILAPGVRYSRREDSPVCLVKVKVQE